MRKGIGDHELPAFGEIAALSKGSNAKAPSLIRPIKMVLQHIVYPIDLIEGGPWLSFDHISCDINASGRCSLFPPANTMVRSAESDIFNQC